MSKSQKLAKYNRKAGSIFPAFSFFRLSSKSNLVCLLLLSSLLLCFSCRPKTGIDLQSSELTTVIDSIAIVDGNPNENEEFDKPIEEITIDEKEKDPIPELLLSFSKKGCYGVCPEYEFKMFSNGHLIYVGQDNVKNIGNYEARIDPLRIYKIYEIADQYRIFQMEEFYPKNGKLIGELPSTVTFLKREKTEKSIHNNHDSPASLRKFESFLEEWVNTILWNKMDQ